MRYTFSLSRTINGKIGETDVPMSNLDSSNPLRKKFTLFHNFSRILGWVFINSNALRTEQVTWGVIAAENTLLSA